MLAQDCKGLPPVQTRSQLSCAHSAEVQPLSSQYTQRPRIRVHKDFLCQRMGGASVPFFDAASLPLNSLTVIDRDETNCSKVCHLLSSLLSSLLSIMPSRLRSSLDATQQAVHQAIHQATLLPTLLAPLLCRPTRVTCKRASSLLAAAQVGLARLGYSGASELRLRVREFMKEATSAGLGKEIVVRECTHMRRSTLSTQ